MKEPIAWIVEPKGDGKPYLTLSLEVAQRRKSKGDFVTEYHSQKPQDQNEGEEL